MDKVLVTGASGFIGSAVARLLLKEGFDVHCLARPQSPPGHLEDLDARIVPGDLRDPGSLQKATGGMRYLFHAAAHYRLFNRPRSLPYQINVEGTRDLFAAAKRSGVERVVYTSSVAAVGIDPGSGMGNEETPLHPSQIIGDYKRSKILAEQEAMRWVCEEGLPVVLVNPAMPVGHGDIKPTPTGRIVLNYLKGKMGGYLDTGLNVVDVEDVAMGHLAALRKGRVGQRYILGNRNMTLLEIFHALESLTGIAAPRWKVPYPLAWGAGLVGELIGTFTGKEPAATLDAVRMAKKKMFYQSSKAVRELGMPQTPVREAFAKAIAWFCTRGYVPADRLSKIRRETTRKEGMPDEATIAR